MSARLSARGPLRERYRSIVLALAGAESTKKLPYYTEWERLPHRGTKWADDQILIPSRIRQGSSNSGHGQCAAGFHRTEWRTLARAAVSRADRSASLSI